jgi:hypothetical protein
MKIRNMLSEKETKEELRFYPTEVFKEISLGEDDNNLQRYYAISNFGRLISYRDKIENGSFVKGSLQDGYRIWRYRISVNDKAVCYRHRFFYKLVAEYFIPKRSAKQVYVLHLDRDRSNDHVDNLRWATKAEMLRHSRKSPFVKAARKRLLPLLWAKKGGRKLSEDQVLSLKQQLLAPNSKTPVKTLALQYGISEMQIFRIRSGKNWGDVKVNNERPETQQPRKKRKEKLHVTSGLAQEGV